MFRTLNPKSKFFYTFKDHFDKYGFQAESIKKAFRVNWIDENDEYELYLISTYFLCVFNDSEIKLSQAIKIVDKINEKAKISPSTEISTNRVVPNAEDMFGCFKTTEGDTKKLSDKKLKYLPALLILSQGCTYDMIALNPRNTIVVMEDFSVCVNKYYKDGGLEGSAYFCRSSFLYPISTEELKLKIGANVFFGPNCNISSHYVGDNVKFGNGVITERNSKISNSVLIQNEVRIMEKQEIPAGQTITTQLPLMYGRLKHTNTSDYESFLRINS